MEAIFFLIKFCYDFKMLLGSVFKFSLHLIQHFNVKYFVVMTSKRDLLPMLDVEKKQGNFRAVVSAVVNNSLFKISTPVNPPSGLFIPRAPTPPLIQV